MGELYAYRPVTGYEAQEVRTHVELVSVPIGVRRMYRVGLLGR
jgi:hypothetical protein